MLDDGAWCAVRDDDDDDDDNDTPTHEHLLMRRRDMLGIAAQQRRLAATVRPHHLAHPAARHDGNQRVEQLREDSRRIVRVRAAAGRPQRT